ncbi:hypothetical protein EZV62_009112 [Acer yangbiense]|uniref:Uncharacterized protein n=1 Tax=Acer yangbiense TaxID=1000413 RepID=A0A5C7IER8_9ROSI|nr:hypothetical protein EZV62_009112 [Acer yangbiense]
MADFEPPSFSLGLDLDSQSEPRLPTTAAAAPNPSPQILQDSPANDAIRTGEDLDSLHEFERAEVDNSDVEPEPESTRVLKRLRRGPGPRPTTQSLSSSLLAKKKKQQLERTCSGNGDDDIEEFSSPEDLIFRAWAARLLMELRFAVPLQIMSLLASHRSLIGYTVASACHTRFFHSLENLQSKSDIRFQLLDSDSDSDSDHPSISEDGSHIPTPALDEVCEEYFQSEKEKNASHKFQTDERVDNNKRCHPNMNSCGNFEQCWDSADPLPPAHRYFFHSDPRIQKLIRSHLPNFSLISVVPDRGNQQPSASDIDYMSQFSNGGAPNQKGTQKVNNNRSSTRGRNKSKRSNTEEVSHASEGWVDLKNSATIPKNAGQRQVHASGAQSAGHWYTSPEGRKVYMSKKGQELTGQIAYRQYRKVHIKKHLMMIFPYSIIVTKE